MQRRCRAVFRLLRRLGVDHVAGRIRKQRRAAVIAEFEREAMRMHDGAVDAERLQRLLVVSVHER